jgi:hypothetical protein
LSDTRYQPALRNPMLLQIIWCIESFTGMLLRHLRLPLPVNQFLFPQHPCRPPPLDLALSGSLPKVTLSEGEHRQPYAPAISVSLCPQTWSSFFIALAAFRRPASRSLELPGRFLGSMRKERAAGQRRL